MKISIFNESTMSTFLAIFQLLKNWGTAIECTFSAKGMSIILLSQSKICIAVVNLPTTWFQYYEYPHAVETIRLAIDAGTFVGVLTTAVSKYTNIDLSYEESADTLHVHLHTDSKAITIADEAEGEIEEGVVLEEETNKKEKKSKKAKPKPKTKKEKDIALAQASALVSTSSIHVYYELPLIQLEEPDELNIAPIDYDVGFIMPSKIYYDLVHNLSGFGDTLYIRCDDDSIGLRTVNESGTMRLTIPIDMVQLFEGVEGEIVDMGFCLSIVQKMCLSYKLSENMHVRITRDMPILFRYELEEDGLVEIYAAPKISE